MAEHSTPLGIEETDACPSLLRGSSPDEEQFGTPVRTIVGPEALYPRD